MLTKNPVKQPRVSVWVMSLTILLSLLAFSGSATPTPESKQVETEARISSRSISKRTTSFKQHLRTQLTIDFLLNSGILSTRYSVTYHQARIWVEFYQTEIQLRFFLKPELSTKLVYTPRSANALTFTKG